MRPARLLAAAALAGGALLTLAPAAGAATPAGAWTDPAPVGTFDDVPVVYLEQLSPLGGWAEFESGIASVGFTLVQDAAEPGTPCSAKDVVRDQTAAGGGGRVTFAFDAPFPCNRRYQVRATATPNERPLRQDSPLVLNLWVDVAVPPAPASGLTAQVVDRSVVLRWESPIQAPDFEGFQIQRAVGGGEFEPIAETTELSFADADVPEGGAAHRYQVVAMRAGPEPGTTVFAQHADVVAIDVPPAPREAPAGGGDGGSSVGPGSSSSGGGGPANVRPAGRGPQVSRRTYRPPTMRHSTTVTTLDTGYQETLPFGPRTTPAGDPAVVARIPDESEDETTRQTLLLVAGGTCAFSWAMLLRVVSRKALLAV